MGSGASSSKYKGSRVLDDESDDEQGFKIEEDDDDKEKPRNDKNNVAPKAEVMATDYSSKLEFFIRGQGITAGTNIAVVVYTKLATDPFWTELGMTEISKSDTAYPNWEQPFHTEFRVECVRIIRLELYKIRKPQMIEDLMEQHHIGCCEFNLTEVIMARAKASSEGWKSQRLQTFKKEDQKKRIGRLCIFAEEQTVAKTELYFNASMTGIRSSDFWKKRADPYFLINRTEVDEASDDQELKLFPCFRSEVARRTSDPKFRQVKITCRETCHSDLSQDIIITVHDWYRLSPAGYVGEVVTTHDELQRAAAMGKPWVLKIMRREGPRIKGMTRLPYSIVRKHITKPQSSFFRLLSKTSRASGGSGSKTGRSDSRSGSGSRSPSASKDQPGERTSSKLSERKSSKLSVGAGSRSGSHERASTKGTASSFHSASTGASSQKQSRASTSAGSAGKNHNVFGSTVGQLTLFEFGRVRRYSFLDYVRGGMEIRLMLGIDFTRSNYGQYNEHSLHSLVPRDDTASAYAVAIQSMGEVLRSYDNDDVYPIYGFGAKIPPSHSCCSNCFALTGDFFKPDVAGVDGLLKAYYRALNVVRLHGPTEVSEVIKLCGKLAGPYMEDPKKVHDPRDKPPRQKYWVMVILTDGDINDQEEAIRAIKALEDMPVSVIFMGIGSKDFKFLSDLDSLTHVPSKAKQHGGTTKRRMTKFVKFDEYIGDVEALAAATLQDLPEHVLAYYQMRGMKPRGLERFEDATGQPLPRVLPKKVQNAMKLEQIEKAKVTDKERSAEEAQERGRSKLSKEGATRSSTQSRTQTGSKGSKNRNNSKQQLDSRAASVLSRASGSSKSSGPLVLRGIDEDDEEPEDFDQAPEPESDLSEDEPAEYPIFLTQEKERLAADAVALGYQSWLVERTLRDGIPAASLDCLVDNIMNAGYGKMLSYKDAALEAIPDTGEESGKHSIAGPEGDVEDGKFTSWSDELNKLAGGTVSVSDQGNSRMATLGISGRMRSNLSVSSQPSSGQLLPAEGESASRASGNDGKRQGSRSTSKTLQEVAGRLGQLPSRTKSKNEDGFYPTLASDKRFSIIAEGVESPQDSSPIRREQPWGSLNTDKELQAPAVLPPAASPPPLDERSDWRDTPASSKTPPSTAAPGSKSEPPSELPSKTVPPESTKPDMLLE